MTVADAPRCTQSTTSSAPTARGRGDCAVDDEVRGARGQPGVLLRRRLALGGVDDDDRAPATGGGGAQLAVEREGAAAAAGESGGRDLIDQVGVARSERTVNGEVLDQGERSVGSGAGEQPHDVPPAATIPSQTPTTTGKATAAARAESRGPAVT